MSTERIRKVSNRQFSPNRRMAPWIGPANAGLRAVPRGGRVYGHIVSRTAVGFNEQDWRYICWIARIDGCTISEVIRGCVSRDRKDTETMLNDDTDCTRGPPWPWDDNGDTFY